MADRLAWTYKLTQPLMLAGDAMGSSLPIRLDGLNAVVTLPGLVVNSGNEPVVTAPPAPDVDMLILEQLAPWPGSDAGQSRWGKVQRYDRSSPLVDAYVLVEAVVVTATWPAGKATRLAELMADWDRSVRSWSQVLVVQPSGLINEAVVRGENLYVVRLDDGAPPRGHPQAIEITNYPDRMPLTAALGHRAGRRLPQGGSAARAQFRR
ncbi:hypothetical protein R8Z50_22065 [Longispora sp. K20-0274]|uniref:hypothetical protein n=1 Tax=Longispora sp. K20-0274 TaxID=3088255 RepID=UPI00399A5A73